MEVISSNADQVSGVWKLFVSGAMSSVERGGDSLSLCPHGLMLVFEEGATGAFYLSFPMDPLPLSFLQTWIGV